MRWPIKIRRLRTARGFALLAALLANLILLAVGLLAIHLATQDIRISAKILGEKKALCAAEAGVHNLIRNFNPADLAASLVTDVQVDPENDPRSRYSVSLPSTPPSGPTMVQMTGYSIGGGQEWGQERYNAVVTGTHTGYETSVEVEVGLGYGPIEITTMYR